MRMKLREGPVMETWLRYIALTRGFSAPTGKKWKSMTKKRTRRKIMPLCWENTHLSCYLYSLVKAPKKWFASSLFSTTLSKSVIELLVPENFICVDKGSETVGKCHGVGNESCKFAVVGFLQQNFEQCCQLISSPDTCIDEVTTLCQLYGSILIVNG